ncbi:MAG: dihydroorotate dehydrogenase electron transfer subunit [Thermodesulfobacteriota bacterium]
MIECEAEISGHREVVPGTFLMFLDAPSIAGSARPGQFVMIRAGSGLDPLLRRPFSICGLYGDGAIGVLYKVVGRGTAVLAEKRSGDRVHILGPLGNGFSAGDASLPLLLVGGGMGVAPLFFLAQALCGLGDRTFRLFTGFNGKAQVLSASDILHLDVAAEVATDDGTMGHAGPVTDLLQAALEADPGSKAAGGVCACGPTAMLERVAVLTAAAGVSCQVSLEASMACGLGACLGCVVHAAPEESVSFFRVCTEGPVFPAQAVDWTRAGPH